MNSNDWKPATSDPRGCGNDRVIGTYNVQDDDIRGGRSESAPPRVDGSSPKRVAGLTRDRVEEIRNRVEDGTYVSAAMAEQVARRMIARGEF